MANILDYIRWRGDLTLQERPFNNVDNLLLAELSFMDFSGIVSESFSDSGVTLKEACAAYFAAHAETDMGVLVPSVIPELARLMGESARFGGARLDGYVNHIDDSAEVQFAALTITTDDGVSYVAFRGTDDTIVGWKEDFNMAFTPIVPAQTEALSYLCSAAAAHSGQKLRVGGHSKGGNLSVYSAVFCGEAVQDQLIAVYNNDGPGFHTSLLDLPEHKRIADRITSILPEFSVVGLLLENEDTFQIVRSDAVGVMQHDGFSWQVERDSFDLVPAFSTGGRIVDETLSSFIRQLEPAQLKQFTDTLFDILYSTDSETLTDLKAGGFRSASKILKKMKMLDKDTRHALSGALRLLLRSGAKTAIDEFKPIQKFRNRKPSKAAQTPSAKHI